MNCVFAVGTLGLFEHLRKLFNALFLILDLLIQELALCGVVLKAFVLRVKGRRESLHFAIERFGLLNNAVYRFSVFFFAFNPNPGANVNRHLSQLHDLRKGQFLLLFLQRSVVNAETSEHINKQAISLVQNVLFRHSHLVAIQIYPRLC